jgi:hypothetical protein
VSELEPRPTEYLMGCELRVDLLLDRGTGRLGERDVTATADAVAQRAQTVDRGGAEPLKAAVVAACEGVTLLGQRKRSAAIFR